jgi:chlorophyllase
MALKRALVASLLPVLRADDDLGFKMHYHAPQEEGTYPVVLFVSGFSGDAPASAYSDFVDKLTDHGFVVVAMDHLKFPNYPQQGEAFHNIMEWTRAGHLQEALQDAGLSATADLDKVAVMGQSAGNHVVGQGLTDGCSLAKAMVMIDPVDGFDPFGIMHSEDLITPGEKLNFTIPSLLLDNELDPLGKNFLFPPCAPAKLGAPRWFDATAGPVWNVNASSYGHIDCLDDLFITAGKFVCPSNKKTDKKAYRTYLADTVALFLDGVLNGNTDKFTLLEDATKFDIAVTVRNDLKGQTHADIKPGCSNTAVQLV